MSKQTFLTKKVDILETNDYRHHKQLLIKYRKFFCISIDVSFEGPIYSLRNFMRNCRRKNSKLLKTLKVIANLKNMFFYPRARTYEQPVITF